MHGVPTVIALQLVSLTVLLVSLGLNAQAQSFPPEMKSTVPTWHDPSPHTVQMIRVEKDVQLEVLDLRLTQVGRPYQELL